MDPVPKTSEGRFTNPVEVKLKRYKTVYIPLDPRWPIRGLRNDSI